MSLLGHNKSNVNVNSLTPEQKKDLKKVIQELDNSLTRIAAEREYQKEAIEEISTKLGLDKKLVKLMAKVHHKANFNDTVEENKTFEEFYDMVINNEE